MHTARPLLSMLVVATLAADSALVARLVDRGPRWPDLPVAVAMGLAVGQINLATVWGVLSNRHLPWRMAALIVVPLGWGFAMAASTPEILPDFAYDQVATWGVHFLTQTVSMGSILILARLRGAVLLPPPAATRDQGLQRRQFSLRALFAWLTSTAIILGALKTAFDQMKLSTTALDWPQVLILGVVGAMAGLISLWLILGIADRMRNIAATSICAVPIAVVLTVMAFVTSPPLLLAVFLLWLIAGLYSGAAWFVLRTAGFHLVWLKAGDADRSAPQLDTEETLHN